MKFKKILITIPLVYILALGQTAWANCPQDVQVIKQGQTANCDGFLFSKEAGRKADDAVEDAKYYKELSDKLLIRKSYSDQQINLLDERLKLYVDQSNVLAKELTAKQNEDKWQKLMWFGLGVLATGIAVRGAQELER